MPKISSIFGLLERIESVDIAVNQHRCAVVRNRNAQCMRCVNACTSGCIAMVDDELVITPDKCIGCGTCATVCPTCALEALNPNDEELLLSAAKVLRATQGEVVFACEQILSKTKEPLDPEKLIVLPCLGRVEETLLISLVNAGATRFSLVKANCEKCDYAVGLTTAQAVCDTTNTLLETWNKDVRANIVEELPAIVFLAEDKEYDESKREFFTGLYKGAKSTAADIADSAVKTALGEKKESEEEEPPKPKYVKVTKEGVLPRFLPTRRRHLLENLIALGEPQDVMIDTRLFGHVMIDLGLCNSCQMCATFCPTGAISKIPESDGGFGIIYIPSVCVKCRCCTDICNMKALTLSEEIFAIDIPTIARERIDMKPLDTPKGGEHSFYNAMKGLFGIDEVYER